MYQQRRSPFISTEPLHSLLLSLPHTDPKDDITDYDYSQCLEPRDANPEDIVWTKKGS